MCKYCKEGIMIESVKSDLDAFAFVDDDSKELNTGFEDVINGRYEREDIATYYITVAIKFCPMCGRKL